MNSDFRDRLLVRARRAGLTLQSSIVDALEAYYGLLTHWNERINLTSLALEPLTERTLDRLIVEPLMAAEYVDDRPLNWFDLGSGGGSPAIPLKIARPRTRLTLVESRSRKAAFLREVVRELHLADIDVIADRIEGLASGVVSPAAELITARALRMDAPMMSIVASMLVPEGRLLFFGAADSAPSDEARLVLESTVDLQADGTSKLFVFSVPRGTLPGRPNVKA